MALPPRRFSLFDVMILVAATAIGLAIERATNWNLPQGLRRTLGLGADLVTLLDYLQTKAIPFLVTWSSALLIIQFLPPRAPLNRLARRPGALASMIAVLAMILVCAWQGPNLFSYRAASEYPVALYEHAPHVALAIIGAWATLGLTDTWSPEPSWIDRLGRLLGLLWIGVLLLSFLKPYVFLL